MGFSPSTLFNVTTKSTIDLNEPSSDNKIIVPTVFRPANWKSSSHSYRYSFDKFKYIQDAKGLERFGGRGGGGGVVKRLKC